MAHQRQRGSGEEGKEHETTTEKGKSESAAVSGPSNAVAATDDYVQNAEEEAAAVLKTMIRTAPESVQRPKGASVPHPGLASDRLQNYQAEEDSKHDSQKKCGEVKSVLEIVRHHYLSLGLDCGSLFSPCVLHVLSSRQSKLCTTCCIFF